MGTIVLHFGAGTAQPSTKLVDRPKVHLSRNEAFLTLKTTVKKKKKKNHIKGGLTACFFDFTNTD